MRGAAAGRFFVGVRSGGSAVPGKEGRSAAAGQRSARTSENEKSFSASPSSQVSADAKTKIIRCRRPSVRTLWERIWPVDEHRGREPALHIAEGKRERA